MRGFVAVWLGGVSVVLAIVMAPHMSPLRRHAVTTPEIRSAPSSATWQVTHVLAAECECSRAVAEALAQRGPAADASHHVIVVGRNDAMEASLTSAGFTTTRSTAADAFARYGIHGAPWLLVHRPDGQEVYSGGYAPRRPLAARDVRLDEILSTVRAGRVADTFPAFGCIFTS